MSKEEIITTEQEIQVSVERAIQKSLDVGYNTGIIHALEVIKPYEKRKYLDCEEIEYIISQIKKLKKK